MHTQIDVSSHAEAEMIRMRENQLPEMSKCLFSQITSYLNLMHLNIRTIDRKLNDIQNDNLFISADIISFNETHLCPINNLTGSMLGLKEDYTIFRHDHNNSGDGVSLLVKSTLNPVCITMNDSYEAVGVQISNPVEMVIISIYRPPSVHMCKFTNEMASIADQFKNSQTCIVGDFNEDVLLSSNRICCLMFASHRFKQIVTKATCDSGTLIDHVYVSCRPRIVTDVMDCYYSDHDFVLCSINF